MIVIQALLIIAVCGIGVILLRGRNMAKIRASQKLLLISFMLLAIVTIVWPEITNEIAEFLGVGRGADLLLYINVVAFGLFALNVYFRFKEQELRVAKLARKIALLEAKDKN